MRALTEGGRALALYAGNALDQAKQADDSDLRARLQTRVDLLVPVVKAWCTDRGVEVTSTAIQVLGGMGFIEEGGVAQHYRDARIAPIYEGTNGIQAIDLVGRKLTRDGGTAMNELIEDIRQTVEDCATSSNPELPVLADRLKPACDALEEASQWLLKASDEDRLAAATPFLKLAGDVTGGWLLSVGAVAAQRMLKEGSNEAGYANARISLARVYAETVLTSAPGLVGDVMVGAEPLFGPGEAMLESA